jgi:hypothetical protein
MVKCKIGSEFAVNTEGKLEYIGNLDNPKLREKLIENSEEV